MNQHNPLARDTMASAPQTPEQRVTRCLHPLGLVKKRKATDELGPGRAEYRWLKRPSDPIAALAEAYKVAKACGVEAAIGYPEGDSYAFLVRF